jgi:hypothetical protein
MSIRPRGQRVTRALAFSLVIATAQMAAATPGAWKQVGPTGGWKNTTAATGLGGKLYTTEGSGALYVTNVDAGTWKIAGQERLRGDPFPLRHRPIAL